MKSQTTLSVQLRSVANGFEVFENGIKIFHGSISEVRCFLDHLENQRRISSQNNSKEFKFFQNSLLP